jgi:uncharacterized membrane protein YgcG
VRRNTRCVKIPGSTLTYIMGEFGEQRDLFFIGPYYRRTSIVTIPTASFLHSVRDAIKMFRADFNEASRNPVENLIIRRFVKAPIQTSPQSPRKLSNKPPPISPRFFASQLLPCVSKLVQSIILERKQAAMVGGGGGGVGGDRGGGGRGGGGRGGGGRGDGGRGGGGGIGPIGSLGISISNS